MLFEIDGFRVITDPILTSRVVHLRRRVEVPTIDPVDVVLISHLHMDHLHLRSLRTVAVAHASWPPPAPPSCSGRSTSRRSTRSSPATSSHSASQPARRRRSRRESCWPTTPTLAVRTPGSWPNRSATSSKQAAERSTSPATPTCSTRCTLPADRRRPAADLGLGADARGPPPRSGAGGDGHPLDRAEVRRTHPLGHVHADHPEARHTGVDREPVREPSPRHSPSSSSPTDWSRCVRAGR